MGPVTSLAVLSLALWSGLFWLVPAAGQSLAEHTMTAPQARALVEAGQAVLVDIRQPEEWRETGMAQGAVGISMLHPDGGPGFLRDLNVAVEDQSDATIILICRTGNRTGQVLRALREWGFSEVYHVPEGMIGSRFGPGWIPGGLPIEPCRSC
ncbi:MAG: rhodanese-like domain-containing protein [Wenzhouxiangella sp.]